MELQDRAEARAAQARSFIDDLAARVGEGPQIKQDALTSCVPSQDDSGLSLIYTVHVTVDDAAVHRLQGEIADHFADEGWTVKRDPVNRDSGVVSVRFQRGTFTMGAKISQAKGRASVAGSGGCVR